jgi:hypothetical protein
MRELCEMETFMPNTDLIRLIKSIGQSTFVRYYREFADLSLSNQDVASMLPLEYTSKSRKSRTSKARRIFREALEEDALILISDSAKVDAETATQAQALLNQRMFGKRRSDT